MRLPALLGGLLYIFATYRLTALLTRSGVLSWSLFACFVYNPFIVDYLVAARGYGLVSDDEEVHGSLWRAAGISACVALAICANFSFGIAGGSLLLVTGLIHGLRLRRRATGPMEWAQAAASFAVPALLILLVLAGSALTRLPRDQLFWGSTSFTEAWVEIRHACWDELNPNLVNPLLAAVLESGRRELFRALSIVGVVYLFLILGGGRKLQGKPTRSRLRLAGAIGLVVLLAVSAHWLQFKLFKIPLPLERTSIWFVPLATAFVGVVVSIRPFHRIAAVVHGCGVAILLFAGVYSIGELRDTHFNEWKNDADIWAAYGTVVELCHRLEVREVAAGQNLATSYNFYRDVYKTTDVDVFPNFDKMRTDRTIYVLPEPFYGDLIRDPKLQVVWRGHTSNMVVLIRPVKQ